MLDIRWIREHSDEAKKRLASRHGGEDAKVDELLELDVKRRALLTEVEQLKAERKAASKEIGALMGQKKTGGGRSTQGGDQGVGRSHHPTRQAGP